MLMCPMYEMVLKLAFKKLVMKYVKRRKPKGIVVIDGGEMHRWVKEAMQQQKVAYEKMRLNRSGKTRLDVRM